MATFAPALFWVALLFLLFVAMMDRRGRDDPD